MYTQTLVYSMTIYPIAGQNRYIHPTYVPLTNNRALYLNGAPLQQRISFVFTRTVPLSQNGCALYHQELYNYKFTCSVDRQIRENSTIFTLENIRKTLQEPFFIERKIDGVAGYVRDKIKILVDKDGVTIFDLQQVLHFITPHGIKNIFTYTNSANMWLKRFQISSDDSRVRNAVASPWFTKVVRESLRECIGSDLKVLIDERKKTIVSLQWVLCIRGPLGAENVWVYDQSGLESLKALGIGYNDPNIINTMNYPKKVEKISEHFYKYVGSDIFVVVNPQNQKIMRINWSR
jgi:hypothetical protein